MKGDVTRRACYIDRQPAGANARIVIGGAGPIEFHIGQITRNRPVDPVYSHTGVQSVRDVKLDGPAITT